MLFRSGRYLSDDIVDRILESPDGLELGGEKLEVSVMMADIRGFTSIAERLPPESVMAMLNNYLAAMTNIIMKHEGTIDEFIGDAILAFFGAPLAREDDSARAVACALAMQEAMAEVNAQNRSEDLPEIAMRISISTGDVVVGNIGSERRSKYAVVGSAINLAARIELHTNGGEVMISDATRRELADTASVAETREIEAKGFEGPVPIHRITAIDGSFEL